MKKIYLLAAAAALFAACSSDKVSLDTPQQPTQLEESAVGFDVYTQRAITRGGWTGALTTAELQDYDAVDVTKAGHYGFGVFGYYTDNNEYDQRSTPNFFYNQQVTYQGLKWVYEPVKYWPNEYGSNAVSEDQDKVTYFAYAPWVNVIATSGKLADTDNQAEEWGITGMTRNSNQGDPILKYIAQFNANRSVDLCWGVADNNDGIWPVTKGGNSQTIANGTPWIDVERPANTGQKVKFTFKHATAQLRINIDAFVDGTNNTIPLDQPTDDNDGKTRIWVREVTFKGFTMKGALNLHNEDAGEPKWLDYGGQNELVAEGVTIYDGRKDGKEGVNGAVATNEKVLGLNPTLVQDGIYKGDGGVDVYAANALKVYGIDASGQTTETSGYERAGVTNSTVNLFDQFTNATGRTNQSVGTSADDAPFHVIPTDEPFEVEIVYDVETVSENLAQNLSDGQTKGTSIENRIRKEIVFYPNLDATKAVKKLEAGHSYTLNLHLGMNSVKFDAAVTDWIDVAAQDVDLPLNTPKYPVGTPSTYSVTIPYKGNYQFALTGLDGGETVTNAVGSPTQGWTSPAANANTSGVAVVTIVPTVNPTTANRTHKHTWTGSQSTKAAEFTFTQQAHPLYMAITGFSNDKVQTTPEIYHGKITLTRYNDESHGSSSDWGTTSSAGWHSGENGVDLDNSNGEPEASTPQNGIAVYRNGSKLTWKEATLPTDKNNSDFNFDDTGESSNQTQTIIIGDKLQAGDVIKVVIKTGNAPVETVTAIVGGISFAFTSRTVPYRTEAYTDMKAIYYGSSENPDISYSISGDATLDGSNGNIKTAKKGTATMTATLGTTSALDFAGTATYTLNIVEQGTKIVWNTEDSKEISKTVAETGADAVIIPVADLKARFKVQGDEDATPAGCTISTVTGPDSGAIFIDSSGNLKVGGAALTAGTYTINLTVEGSGSTDYYEDPEPVTLTLTVKVTNT